MSFTLTFGQEGNCATAEVLWSVDGKTYRFRSDNNFVAWISTIFTVADVVNGGGGDLLVSSDELPPVQGGNGNLWAEYSVGLSVVGNARGVGAVDWQQSRNLATEVASGPQSTVGGGSANTASGQYAVVGGGNNNTASGTYATVGGGNTNTASADYSTLAGGYSNTISVLGTQATIGGGKYNGVTGDSGTIAGGYQNSVSGYRGTVGGGTGNNASGGKSTVGGGRANTASGIYATVGGGNINTASGSYATVIGGEGALASRYGMVAHASGVFAGTGSAGSAQAVEFIARNATTGATTAVLFLDGSSTRFGIRNNTVLSGICTISGFSTTGAKVGLYQRSISIKNVAGTTTLVHSSTISTDHEDDATWNVTITADNVNDSLEILCLGSAGDTVRWVAVFRGLEITMP